MQISGISSLIQDISAFYVMRRFITIFIRARSIECITEVNGIYTSKDPLDELSLKKKVCITDYF